MKLPYAAKARVDRKKVVEYLLSFSHPDGSSEAEFFSRFGFRVDDWRVLARALRKHGRENTVSVSVQSAYEIRHSVDARLRRQMDVILNTNGLDSSQRFTSATTDNGASEIGELYD